MIPQVTLGALANNIVVTGTLTSSADGQYRAMSVKLLWSIRNVTVGQGPIIVGFAHSDYSVTEIKEAIEIASSINIGDKVSNEKANRLVRVVGVFSGAESDQVLNDGKPMKTRLNWQMPIGANVNVFAYNDSGAALTTGGLVEANGDLWVKDN